MAEKHLGEKPYRSYGDESVEGSPDPAVDNQSAVDVFGPEEHHDIQYKTLSWQLVAVLMIAEIVSNGMLSLPSSLAVVGLVPGLILIVFLGMFALFTSWLLIQFKLRHPQGKRNAIRCFESNDVDYPNFLSENGNARGELTRISQSITWATQA